MNFSKHFIYCLIYNLIIFISVSIHAAQIPSSIVANANEGSTSPKSKTEPSVKIKCLKGIMLITIKDPPTNHETGLFSGMVYPKGLSKNSTCLMEYRDHESPLRYKLPLRSCNTMPQETDDGGIEFFNTIVLQPHLKLITDAGRGYHVRCRYKSREAATIINKKYHKNHYNYMKQNNNPKAQAFQSAGIDSMETVGDRRTYGRSLTPIHIESDDDDDDAELNYLKSNDDDNLFNNYDYNQEDNDDDDDDNDRDIIEIPMPGCHMKIYNADHKIANDVKIGDPLTIVINIDKQDSYGLHITDCIVRDGLGWGEQRLMNENGCPMDNEIMGQFNYTIDRLAANVTFPAHKFPYTTSVYYQCNVKLCAITDPICREDPVCGSRRKRQTLTDIKDDDGMPATIEVFSGLYVNENVETTEDDESVFKEKTLDGALCVSQRTFAIAIAIAGLILMLAVVAAVLCIMAKRSTKSVSHSGSSIYSGPYTNTAFSHSS